MAALPPWQGKQSKAMQPARERTVARTGERKTDQCYSLKSVTLEITSEPVTEGKVEYVLGNEFFREFAKRFKAGLNSGDFDNTKLFYQLSRNSFIED